MKKAKRGITLGEVRQVIYETLEDAEAEEERYEAAKRSMVKCTLEQYYEIYQELHDELRTLETRTNVGDMSHDADYGPGYDEKLANDPTRHIYTLWGMYGDDNEMVPVISSREVGGETRRGGERYTFKANPKFLK